MFPFEDLDADTNYDISFTVGYYGNLPYKYAGGFHKTRPVSDHPYLVKISEHLTKMLPEIRVKNSKC